MKNGDSLKYDGIKDRTDKNSHLTKHNANTIFKCYHFAILSLPFSDQSVKNRVRKNMRQYITPIHDKSAINIANRLQQLSTVLWFSRNDCLIFLPRIYTEDMIQEC